MLKQMLKMGLTTVRPSTFPLYDKFDVVSTSRDHKNTFTWSLRFMRSTAPPHLILKFFVQDIFSSMHISCVNFIKIAPLLRVGSIQVKNIGLWGVPLPLARFQKFFVQDIFSSIPTFCENCIMIAVLSRVGSIQVENIGLWGVPLPPARF